MSTEPDRCRPAEVVSGVVPVLAEVVRSGFVEAKHHGALVVVDPGGTTEFAVGDVTEPIFPRSSNKPMQAVGMLRAGLELDGELLALASASHAGEEFHVDGARRILAAAGLAADALQCPPDWPGDPDAQLVAIRSGEPKSRLSMNCSGKHAAMLAACVAAGWPIETYLDPEHPLQRLIADCVQELSGEKVAHTGVDGCGAPLLAISLTALARAFGAIVSAAPGTPERRVADAVRANPTWTSGTKRDEAALMAGLPGAFGKAGAEGCYAVALPDGRAVALKLDDGAARARPVVMAAVLHRLGYTQPVVTEQLSSPIHGGGEPVGEIRPAAALR